MEPVEAQSNVNDNNHSSKGDSSIPRARRMRSAPTVLACSLGAIPSELLLFVRRRWPYGTNRPIKGGDPLRHSRLLWQLRSPWCRLIRRTPSPSFILARRLGSAMHSPLHNLCLKQILKSSKKGMKPCPSLIQLSSEFVLYMNCQDPIPFFLKIGLARAPGLLAEESGRCGRYGG